MRARRGPEIRLLGAADVEAFRAIRLEALRREPASFASSLVDWEALTPDEWRGRMKSGPIVAAFRDEEAVGLMGLLLRTGRRMVHRATVIMVYVRREERGVGLADAMLATLVEMAREMRIRQLELHASTENPQAIRFYLRSGFNEIGRIPGGFIHEGREVGEVLMARRLAPDVGVSAPRSR